jgi:hypothetical protein
MGGFSTQVQQGQTSGGGKAGSAVDSGRQGLGFVQKAYENARSQNSVPTSELQGANGVITNSATSGQPSMGAPNQYPNTVGQGDNAVQQFNQSRPQLGKGKGA